MAITIIEDDVQEPKEEKQEDIVKDDKNNFIIEEEDVNIIDEATLSEQLAMSDEEISGKFFNLKREMESRGIPTEKTQSIIIPQYYKEANVISSKIDSNGYLSHVKNPFKDKRIYRPICSQIGRYDGYAVLNMEKIILPLECLGETFMIRIIPCERNGKIRMKSLISDEERYATIKKNEIQARREHKERKKKISSLDKKLNRLEKTENAIVEKLVELQDEKKVLLNHKNELRRC